MATEVEEEMVVVVVVKMLHGATHTVSFPGHKSRDELGAEPNALGAGPKPFGPAGAHSALALSGPIWARRLRKQAEQFAEGASMPT
jgi:hypothetical protein